MMLAATALTLCMFATPDDGWIRSQWTDDQGRLEVAARRYESSQDPALPSIWLIGVTHVGDAHFYDQLVELMDGTDVVIYESVLPPGGTPPSLEAIDQRAAATAQTASLLASLHAGLPREQLVSWNAANKALTSRDRRIANLARDLSRDGWGVPWRFHSTDDGSAAIGSFGADGRIGGTGDDADLVELIPTEDQSSDHAALQRKMADMMGLAFQLDALDYGDRRWRPGDMRIDQVQEAFEQRGASVEGLTGLMAGTGLMGGLVHGVLDAIPVLDGLFGGRVVDTMQVIIIEMLGQEELIDGALDMQGDVFREVIINMRNDAALAAVDRAAADMTPGSSIAVLYGGGHMPQMAETMEGPRGYQAVETRWHPAITFNISESPLSPAEVAMLRGWLDSMGSSFFGR